MLHDLIKAANRNLAPGADPEKDWLKYSEEPCFVTGEDMEEAEYIELEEGDEYEECECEEVEQNTAVLYTTVEELGYDDSLESIDDSEVLEEFVHEVCRSMGEYFPKRLKKADLESLDFIDFDTDLHDNVTVTIYKEELRNYLN